MECALVVISVRGLMPCLVILRVRWSRREPCLLAQVIFKVNITSEVDLREAVRKTETYLESASSQRSVVPFGKPKSPQR